jgi:hypothetical protein
MIVTPKKQKPNSEETVFHSLEINPIQLSDVFDSLDNIEGLFIDQGNLEDPLSLNLWIREKSYNTGSLLNFIDVIFSAFISNPYVFIDVVNDETEDFTQWLKNQDSWESGFESSPLFSPFFPVNLSRDNLKLSLEVLIDPFLKILCSMVKMKDVLSFLKDCGNWEIFFDNLNNIVQVFDSHVELKRIEPLGSGGNGEVMKYRIDGIESEVNVAAKFFFSNSTDFYNEISVYNSFKNINNNINNYINNCNNVIIDNNNNIANTSNNNNVLINNNDISNNSTYITTTVSSATSGNNNNKISCLKILNSDPKRRMLLFGPIGTKVTADDLNNKMVVDLVKDLRYIHKNINLVHRDIRMENLLIIGEDKDKKLILIDWGKSARIGEKKAVAGTIAYGSRGILDSGCNGKEHEYSASDDLSSFVRILLSLKITDIETDLRKIINFNFKSYVLDILNVWKYYSHRYKGFEDALKAGDDGNYDKIIDLIQENYFLPERI